ncbi:MAG TPA: STAS domain-containing protein [Acidimicrobiales bacterium]|nr:STAS domain-containing protein [Acidimicrobiales bacterium]
MLDVRCQCEEDALTFTLRGEVTDETAPLLDSLLRAALTVDVPLVVVDISGLTEFAASGLPVLVSLSQRCRNAGRSLSMRGPTDGPFGLLQLAVD